MRRLRVLFASSIRSEQQSDDYAAERLDLSHVPGRFPSETAGTSLDERVQAPVEKHAEHTDSTNLTVGSISRAFPPCLR